MTPTRRRPGRRAWQTAALLAAATALAATAIAVAGPTGPVANAAITGNLKVNMVAYAPNAGKHATVVTTATSPVTWTLRNSAGQQVATGQTTVFGADAASGDNVHKIDFSAYRVEGTNYTLVVNNEASQPFDIATTAWKQLPIDALAYFYHNRSGIAIDAQYVGSQYARPAGHLNVSPNQGDNNVGCRPGTNCGYTLDLRGGWYDAGDHGKYVVNGGIATWQLVNIYERLRHSTGNTTALGDGTLRLPERANGVPDILDEARWNIDFMLRMQVPDGRTNAGMVHHKMHDANWTGIPTRPDQDNQARYVAPVSTAATLNVAAVGAQCARVWATIDATFANRCLTVAEKAYTAAKANPNLIASNSDGTGGGAYGDSKVTDEFYWAAAELYVTTGKSQYQTDVMNSSLYYGASFANEGFGWADVGPLGDITLAVVPNNLPITGGSTLRDRFVTHATNLLTVMNSYGYPIPMRTTNGSLFWGANSNILNNTAVLALAHDFTGDARFRDAVFETMAYLLGRNPLNQSYVSGYGEQAMRNSHHRFWANQFNSSYPITPPGALSGGPNSGLDDPWAAANLAGCRPMKCWADNAEAYALNEVTINWNSALAWVATWTAEKAGPGTTPTTPPTTPPTTRATTPPTTPVTTPPTTPVTTPPTTPPTTRPTTPPTTAATTAPTTPPTTGGPAGCTAAYKVVGQWPGGFQGEVTVTNTATTATTGWAVSWTFANGQAINQIWGATAAGAPTVTARNVAWNGALAPGASATFGFIGAWTGTNPVPTPITCTRT